jgi:hypothetical protein
MKTQIMLMMAALTIFSLISFAQDITSQSLSPKEKMKMEVMKIAVAPAGSAVKSNTPDECPVCRIDLNLSKKEQMKLEAMKTHACSMQTGQTSDNSGKCLRCVMQPLTAGQTGRPHFCNMNAGVAGKISNSGAGLNLSSKEKMKMGIMNPSAYSVYQR